MSYVLDSSKTQEEISKGGNLAFIWNTFKRDPKKVLVGVKDSFSEVIRWLFAPRFSMPGISFGKRFAILRHCIKAEMTIPGGTTTLEALWITYGIFLSKSASDNWIEAGCYKGLSSVRLGLMAKLLSKKIRIYDTFQGLPKSEPVFESVDNGVNYEFKEGAYYGTDTEVMENIKKFGLEKYFTLIKGDINKTLPDPQLSKISFAFLDVDLAYSYSCCFKGIASHIEKGTLVVIHEACYKPIRDLVEDKNFWKEINCPAPQITYIADTFKIPSCRGLAFLSW
jgi:hypothetical protein